MLEAAIAGAVAGYAIAIPVGAIAILILHIAINHGLHAGIAAAFGAATADFIYASVAVVVGSAAAGLVGPVLTPFRLAAGVVLMGLAVRGFMAVRSVRDPAAERARAVRHGARRTYATLLALTLLNPATVAYFAALVVGLPSLGGAPERATFAIAAFGASASWQLVLALVGSVLGRGSGHRIRTASSLVGNSMVLGFGLLVISQALSE